MTQLGVRNPLVRFVNGARAWLAPRPVPHGPPRALSVIGHRGSPLRAPENTLESFLAALEQGADGIETDVSVTRDGVFVLWHDARPNNHLSLARQGNAEGYRFVPDAPRLGSQWRRPLEELTLEELRATHGYVRAGGSEDAERIPIVLLDDALAWAESEPRLETLCVDVKLLPHQTSEAGPLLLRLRRVAQIKNVIVQSNQREVVAAMLEVARRETLPERLRICADFELPGVLGAARRLGASSVSLGCSRRFWAAVRDDLVDLARERDAGRMERVLVWTCNDLDQLIALERLRVDGIITDRPDLLRRLVSGAAVG